MRSRGMDIAVVETGGDPGHQPARAAYQAAGFTLLPIARCASGSSTNPPELQSFDSRLAQSEQR